MNGIKLDKFWYFSEGYACVVIDNKWNHMGTDGKLVSEQWWDWCGDFIQGRAKVRMNGKWNYIRTDGKLVSEQFKKTKRGHNNERNQIG